MAPWQLTSRKTEKINWFERQGGSSESSVDPSSLDLLMLGLASSCFIPRVLRPFRSEVVQVTGSAWLLPTSTADHGARDKKSG